ncbi:uncharacterized protein LOC121060817 isoform X2 [Cygnus olor]|uniref:uncharacterized protein LOC121060817 isoform X2 n=1 Tax=Cygnus olor TaxID=8869 RepID=UPI001ADEA655|nr:uncharacterized protein LOC121060817 isoform X2 [Cygnus olor]
MARRAPPKRRPGASPGPLQSGAACKAAGEAAGPSHGCLHVQVGLQEVRHSLELVPGSASQEPARQHGTATEAAGTVVSTARHLARALVLQTLPKTCIFAAQKMTLHKKEFLKIFIMVSVTLAAGAVCCGTSRLAWKTGARKAAQRLLAETESLRNSLDSVEVQAKRIQLLLEQVASLRAELSSVTKEVQEVKWAASETASEDDVQPSDRALKSSAGHLHLTRTATRDVGLASGTNNTV